MNVTVVTLSPSQKMRTWEVFESLLPDWCFFHQLIVTVWQTASVQSGLVDQRVTFQSQKPKTSVSLSTKVDWGRSKQTRSSWTEQKSQNEPKHLNMKQWSLRRTVLMLCGRIWPHGPGTRQTNSLLDSVWTPSQLLHSCPRERQLEPCTHSRNPPSSANHTREACRFIKNLFCRSSLVWTYLLRDFLQSPLFFTPLNWA